MRNPGEGVNVSRIIIRVVLGAVMLAAVLIIVFAVDLVRMQPQYDFSTAAQAVFGTDGGIVMVDQGKTAI